MTAAPSGDDQTPTAAHPDTPPGDDTATMTCPVCQRPFTPSGRRRYCRDACRRLAWKRRRHTPPTPVVVPPGRPRRPLTVYQCPSCDLRAVGEQRCDDCHTFMQRVGLGGPCPHCEEAVAVADLLDRQAAPEPSPGLTANPLQPR